MPTVALHRARDTQRSPNREDRQSPRRHFRIRDPVRLDGTEAERLYRIVREANDICISCHRTPVRNSTLGHH